MGKSRAKFQIEILIRNTNPVGIGEIVTDWN